VEGNPELAERIPARLSVAQGRHFGFTVGGAFLVLAAIFVWSDRDRLLIASASLGSLLVLAALLLPTRLGPVERAWMGFAYLVSRVTTPLFLGALYLLVFAPIGLLMRLAGKRPLKRCDTDGGFWVERAESRRRSNLQRQF
jgi:saxitoxin biosynthesis operon SxtJ-like protein